MPEYNLIIDLDSTMICSIKILYNISNFTEVDKMTRHPNFIYYLNCKDCLYLVFARPKLKEFLQDAYKNFNLYVFTLANRSYAEPIVKKLEELYKVKFLKIWTDDELEIDKRTKKKLKCICITKLDNDKTFIMDDNPSAWFNHIDQEIKLIRINPYNSHYEITYTKEIEDNPLEKIEIKDTDVDLNLMYDMLIYLDHLKKLINNEYIYE